MVSESQTIYLDESGFTGNNLSDINQPIFVYGSVAISSEHADHLHSDVISRFKINSPELKGMNLVKHKSGREAISWLLNEIAQYSHITVVDKRYALAGKFFEYVFEPVLSHNNSLFYARDFHKFIATLLYIHLQVKDVHTSKMLDDFEQLMRGLQTNQVDSMLSSWRSLPISGYMGAVLTFAYMNQTRIKHEIELLQEMHETYNWILELSGSSVHWLLASWGEKFESLDVYCDESKPIKAAMHLFNAMIGRTDKAYVPFFGNHPSIVYNLNGPIKLVDSKDYPGVQIADILSSSMAYTFRNLESDISQAWINIMGNSLMNPILPEEIHVDISQERAAVNSAILLELANRSVKGDDLLEGMAEFILEATVNWYQMDTEIY